MIFSKKRLSAASVLTACIMITALSGCYGHEKENVAVTFEPAKTLCQETEEPFAAESKNNTEEELFTKAPAAEQPAERICTVKQLFKTALEPVGNTLYIYGGGWNEEDTGAGNSAVTIGLSPQWKLFYDSMDADYNSSEHRYEIENGLDCTGYIGWVIYNVFNTESGNDGYVYFAKDIVYNLASLGLGTAIDRGQLTDRIPGDIMGSSIANHAWINIGMCEDGSVVLLHSSPPGVGLCAASATGNGTSKADELVRYYMSKYYPEYYGRYSVSTRGSSYLTDYDCFRWDRAVLDDPEGYRNMTAEQILSDLFEES